MLGSYIIFLSTFCVVDDVTMTNAELGIRHGYIKYCASVREHCEFAHDSCMTVGSKERWLPRDRLWDTVDTLLALT
jgi:hypothetical protein